MRNVSVLSPTLVYFHGAGLSSVQQQIHVLVTVACSVSDWSSSVLSSSVFLLIRLVSLSPAHCGALCSCSLGSDLLWAGLDQLSCQAAAGNPDGLLVRVQVWQAEPVPAHHGPVPVRVLQLRFSCKHTQGGFTIYSFFFFFKPPLFTFFSFS